MHTRVLGNTGLEVTEISFGAYAVGGTTYRGGTSTGWTGSNIFESLQLLRKAWDIGINFFDTADAYGRGKSEVLLGMALHYVKNKVIIASKGGSGLAAPIKDFSEAHLRGALDSSLSRLECDYLDLYILHSPSIKQMDKRAFHTMRSLKEEGRIHSWRVSVNGIPEALHAIDNGAEVLQIVYNILEPEIGNAVFPIVKKNNVGIIVREALCSGLLSGKFKKDHVFPPEDHRSIKFPASRINSIVNKLEQMNFLLEDCTDIPKQLCALCFQNLRCPPSSSAAKASLNLTPI